MTWSLISWCYPVHRVVHIPTLVQSNVRQCSRLRSLRRACPRHLLLYHTSPACQVTPIINKKTVCISRSHTTSQCSMSVLTQCLSSQLEKTRDNYTRLQHPAEFPTYTCNLTCKVRSIPHIAPTYTCQIGCRSPPNRHAICNEGRFDYAKRRYPSSNRSARGRGDRLRSP